MIPDVPSIVPPVFFTIDGNSFLYFFHAGLPEGHEHHNKQKKEDFILDFVTIRSCNP
jgi:catalase